METQDQEHLRLLSIFHYVVAGLLGLFACFPLIYAAMGLFLVFGASKFATHGETPPPAFLGWIFVAIGLFFSLLGWALVICIVIAGRSIAARKRLVFCQAIAGVECLFMPFGTALGVFSLIVLLRPSVKQLFDAADARA